MELWLNFIQYKNRFFLIQTNWFNLVNSIKTIMDTHIREIVIVSMGFLSPCSTYNIHWVEKLLAQVWKERDELKFPILFANYIISEVMSIDKQL